MEYLCCRGASSVACSPILSSSLVCWCLFSFLLFSVLFFLPYEGIICPGRGGRFRHLCLDSILFLSSFHFSFLLVSFLGVHARQYRDGGIRFFSLSLSIYLFSLSLLLYLFLRYHFVISFLPLLCPSVPLLVSVSLPIQHYSIISLNYSLYLSLPHTHTHTHTHIHT